MSLAAPAGLLLLLLLPILWWVHRRMQRRAPVDVPSLLFVREEVDAPPVRRLGMDPELLLGLAAAISMAIAAAGPTLVVRKARRTVTLVVSGGAPALQREWTPRVSAAAARVREVAGDDVDVRVLTVPSAPDARRPLPSTLLATAHASTRGTGLVLSDHAAPGEADAWWAWGREDARNVGIVAASITPDPVGLRVFTLVAASGVGAATCTLVLDAPPAPPRRVSVPLEADGLTSVEIGAAPAPDAFTLRLEGKAGEPWQDDLAADDQVLFRRDPLRIAVSPSLPRAIIQAFDAARRAALGEGGAVVDASRPDLRVIAAGDPVGDGLHLVLHPLRRGQPGRRVGPGRDRRRSDPLVDDLDSRSTDLVLAPSVDELEEDVETLMTRLATPPVPLIVRRGRLIHFLPDPTAGLPSPSRTPLWPLFVENVLRRAGGVVGNAGYRRLGLLDRASSDLGRTRRQAPLLGRLHTLPPDRGALTQELRPLFAGLALFLLALLFAYPWLRTVRTSRS